MRLPHALLGALLMTATASAAPISIVHQGRLLLSDDTPVDEAQQLSFSFHTLETDPSSDPPAPLWARAYPNVPVQKGLYSVVLSGTGSTGGALDTQLFIDAAGPVYLQVTLGGVALLPRLRLGTAPLAAYATEAGNAKKLDGKTIEELKQVFSGREALDALKATGTINTPGNPVDWSQLKNVPTTIVAGVPPVTSGETLSGQGTPGSPLNVVFGTTAGTATAGNDARLAKISQLEAQLDALSASLATTYATQAALTAGLATTVKKEAGGGVRIAADGSACNGTTAGTVRFQGGNFQGCTGTMWANLNNVPPSVETVTPPGGALSGGYTITLRGSGFVSPMSVLVGGTPCTNVSVIGPTTVSATVPSSTTAGPKELRLETADGAAATRPGGFTYTPTTFDLTGASQSFIVPLGVTAINVDISGAAGAKSGANGATGANGGAGGRVQATLAVTPGETLLVFVGGQGVGQNGGGFNGGGQGGRNTNYASPGGQGGGASDLRRTTALAERLVVAGGGGGGGYDQTPSIGGVGGGLTAGDGTIHGGGPASQGRGGGPTAGGAAGSYTSYTTAGQGALGQGGNGIANNNTSTDSSGGGGGGGHYGGGAGAWGGGGGGSSYTLPAATNVVHTLGSRSGNGQVVITFP